MRFFNGGDGENWTPVQTHSHNLSTYLVCVYLLRVLGFSTNKQPSQRALKSVLQNPKPKLCKVARWFDALTAYRVWAIKTGRNLCCCQSANAAVVVHATKVGVMVSKSNDIVRFFICVYFLTEGLGVAIIHHMLYIMVSQRLSKPVAPIRIYYSTKKFFCKTFCGDCIFIKKYIDKSILFAYTIFNHLVKCFKGGICGAANNTFGNCRPNAAKNFETFEKKRAFSGGNCKQIWNFCTSNFKTPENS